MLKDVLYGFENYTLVYAVDSFLTTGRKDVYLGAHYNTHTHIIGKESLVTPIATSGGWYNLKEIYKDHKELLKEGMKLYVHPNCSISRSLVFTKYKKTLNPFMADAVVLPSPPNEIIVHSEALFINEDKKFILILTPTSSSSKVLLKSLKEDTPIKDIVKKNICIRNYTCLNITETDIYNSLFMHFGKSLLVKEEYFTEAITGSLPLHNTIFEESVQESLGDESNKLDYDSLTSIYDLLKSSDASSVGAGLKALSMMDYSGYPNSVRYIFSKVFSYFWGYNRALSSTSVRFMLNKLYKNRWNRRGRRMDTYSETISKKDYDLFKLLYLKYDNEDPSTTYATIDFMKCTPEGNIPILEGAV